MPVSPAGTGAAALQKLMRTVIGTNNIDNCSRICHAPSAATVRRCV